MSTKCKLLPAHLDMQAVDGGKEGGPAGDSVYGGPQPAVLGRYEEVLRVLVACAAGDCHVSCYEGSGYNSGTGGPARSTRRVRQQDTTNKLDATMLPRLQHPYYVESEGLNPIRFWVARLQNPGRLYTATGGGRAPQAWQSGQ